MSQNGSKRRNGARKVDHSSMVGRSWIGKTSLARSKRGSKTFRSETSIMTKGIAMAAMTRRCLGRRATAWKQIGSIFYLWRYQPRSVLQVDEYIGIRSKVTPAIEIDSSQGWYHYH